MACFLGERSFELASALGSHLGFSMPIMVPCCRCSWIPGNTWPCPALSLRPFRQIPSASLSENKSRRRTTNDSAASESPPPKRLKTNSYGGKDRGEDEESRGDVGEMLEGLGMHGAELGAAGPQDHCTVGYRGARLRARRDFPTSSHTCPPFLNRTDGF